MNLRVTQAIGNGFTEGTDAHRVEFEWTPNPERDIAGYRVYQVTGAAPSTADRLACATSISDARPTSCIDDAAPETGILHYYVVAVAPTRVTPIARTASRRSKSRTPPAALTCTCGGAQRRISRRSSSIAPVLP